MVIYDIGEVVSRVAIALDNDEIFFGFALLVSAVYNVLELNRRPAALEPHGVRFVPATLGLFQRNIPAGAWVVVEPPLRCASALCRSRSAGEQKQRYALPSLIKVSAWLW